MRRIRHHDKAPELRHARVILVGYFSGKDKLYAGRMAAATTRLTAAGAQVIVQFVQRRGVSHGGVAKMSWPLARRTLISAGKVREIALFRQQSDADAVVFVNSLTEHQRTVLTAAFGCPVLGGDL